MFQNKSVRTVIKMADQKDRWASRTKIKPFVLVDTLLGKYVGAFWGNPKGKLFPDEYKTKRYEVWNSEKVRKDNPAFYEIHCKVRRRRLPKKDVKA